MSRKSIAEYVAEKRRAYAVSSIAKRTRILNEVCETLDFTRKYVIKLMTGNIRYRERKGRGKTYSDEDLENARKLWISVGCPCSTYFVAELPRIIKEYEECIALIKPASSKSALMSISASTLDRAFKGKPRQKPCFVKRNKRSGVNKALLNAIECKSGEEIMACKVPPGDLQIDTVAHCGGDMHGDFFWTLTQTDRRTQWTEISPTWNHSVTNTLEALKRLARRSPFPVRSYHSDNGIEFINYALADYLGVQKRIPLSRSRFRKKNDNAHVEQKNGSVVRELLGEIRLGCKDLEADLIKLEEEWSDYNNFFRPTKMIIAKYRKDNGKGFTRIYEAGGPITPYKRLLSTKILSKDQETALTKRYESLNGVFLYQQILRRLKRILNKQEKYLQSKREEKRILQEARLEASSLRDAPSGTASAASLLDGTISLLPKPLSKRKQHLKSVKYLTNQKHKNQSQGAHSI